MEHWSSQAYGHRQFMPKFYAAKHIVGNVVNLENCGPCAAAAAAQTRGLGSARLWYLGQANGYAGPGFDMKTDITAGAVAFGVPLAYRFWAPKKWPQPNLIVNVAAVIAIYLSTVWVMRRGQA